MNNRARLNKIPVKARKEVENQLRQIAQIIQSKREEANLTQEKLAEMLGISTISLQYIEQGRRHPSLPMLIYICKVLNLGFSIE